MPGGLSDMIWRQNQAVAGTTPTAAPTTTQTSGGTLETANLSTSTGSRIVVETIRTLEGKIRSVTHTMDLASISANTTSELLVAFASGTCREGDYIDYIGATNLSHGLVVQGCLPAHADDNFYIRISNLTGGAIDQMNTTWFFEILEVQDQ